MEKKLYRNEHDKMIAGVCSGLADYVGTDVTVIRILAVLLIFLGVGSGIPIYIVLWVLLPVNSDPARRMQEFNKYFAKQDPSLFNSAEAFNQEANKWNTPNAAFDSQAYDPNAFKKKNNTGRTILGLFLLVIGIYSLLRVFGLLPYWFMLSKLWPVALIIIGIAFISRSTREKPWEPPANPVETENPVQPTTPEEQI